MAVDTAVSSLSGATSPGLVGSRVVVYQREIDFSVTPLDGTAGEWFEIFNIPKAHLCLGAMLEVVTACTTSGTLALGVGGGNTILTASAADATAATCYASTNTTPILVGALGVTDEISLLAAGADIVAGKVRVTVVLVDCRVF